MTSRESFAQGNALRAALHRLNPGLLLAVAGLVLLLGANAQSNARALTLAGVAADGSGAPWTPVSNATEERLFPADAGQLQSLASFYLPAVDSGPITGLEQRLLTGLNVQRDLAGLAPLEYDAAAGQIARIRCQQMLDEGYFGHVDPDGYTMYVELLSLAGISYLTAGENLALNNYAVYESPERAVASLMRSAAHRENILWPEFTRVGVGEVTAADGRHFYAMVFLG